jgi:hypothetical protein
VAMNRIWTVQNERRQDEHHLRHELGKANGALQRNPFDSNLQAKIWELRSPHQI